MSESNQALDHDAKELKKMGYEQELHRHMGGFSNFASPFLLFVFWLAALQLFHWH